MTSLPRTQRTLKYLDTFAGIGGFALPLEELGHECIGFSETNKYAAGVHLHHFPHHHPYGDIKAIDALRLPAFDLLCGGFPCQAFSVAGKRRGFEDTRGTLFFDLCRIASAKRPRLLLFENVKGLLNHARGHTFGTILASLDGLGYDLQWEVFNSKNFGVPQNRERVFIVGHLRGTPRPQVFPLGGGDGEPDETRHAAGQGIANALRAKSGGPDLEDTWVAHPVVFDLKATASSTRRGAVSAKGYAKTLDHDCAQAVAVRTPLIFQDVRGVKKSQNGRGFKQDDASYTVDTWATQGVLDGVRIRRLTPKECERLQGFADDWTRYGVSATSPDPAEMSDTQRYKMLGNAVTVNVVREVVNRLTNSWPGEENRSPFGSQEEGAP